MGRFLVRIAGSLADQVFSVGALFVANIALARTLANEAYGEFALLYSLYTFLSGIHNGLLLEAFTVFGSGRFQAEFGAYARFGLRANIRVVLVLSSPIVFCALLAPWFPGMGAAAGYAALAIATPVMLTSLFLRRILYLDKRPVRAGMAAIVYFASVCAGLALLRATHRLDTVTALLVLAAGWLVAWPVFAAGMPAERPTDAAFARHKASYWKTHWEYSRWVLLTAVIFQLSAQGYLWLAAILMDTASVAELRAAWNLIQPPTLAFSALSLLILPRLAARAKPGEIGAGLSRELLRYGGIVLAIGLCCLLLAFEFGSHLYAFVYAGKYGDSLDVFLALAVYPVIAGVAGVFGDGLRALEKPRAIFYAYMFGGLLTFLVGVPAILSHGVLGAAWGMVASNAGYALVLVISYFSAVGLRSRGR